ncbi:unnamed protein product [Trichobilharzia regenti]|nr:unnamed protein product [Trichobilharzia regenti]
MSEISPSKLALFDEQVDVWIQVSSIGIVNYYLLF